MAKRQSTYDNLMAGMRKNEDFSDAFKMIINNPYRILGASTFLAENELMEIYKQWEKAPDKYKSQFDKTKLGAPKRTKEAMEWALENADSYVYKLFWFSDPDIAGRLGNKVDFIEFFAKKQGVNTTDYNNFLAQYMFLCVFDRDLTMVEQWGIILNLINDLLNVSVGRFWGFFSGNKIEAIDNNKMAFLYNEFKDNILYPIREIITEKSAKSNLDEVIHIHSVLKCVEHPNIQFARLETIIYEKLERWFVKESDYVNNVLLANVTGINATSMEEKLALTNAYNYIMTGIAPDFIKLVGNIIPQEHSMNTRMRMMFSGKFIVVSKILSNAGLYNESLNLCKLFNELFEDEYIYGEITKLNLIIKQEETTRMKQHAPVGQKNKEVFDEDNKGLAPPSGVGELEELEKERKQEFFNHNSRARGIDYKEVIQDVLSNELRLVKKEEGFVKKNIPFVEIAAAEAEAEAEETARRIKETVEELHKKHELEINEKLETLNKEYKKSMSRWIVVILVILVLIAIALGFIFYEISKEAQGTTVAELFTGVDLNKVKELETILKEEAMDIDVITTNMASINEEIAELEAKYRETDDMQYAEAFAEKKEKYDLMQEEYMLKVNNYNSNLEEYNSMKQ